MLEEARDGERGFGEKREHNGFGGQLVLLVAEKERVGGWSGFQDQAGGGGEVDQGDGVDVSRDRFELVGGEIRREGEGMEERRERKGGDWGAGGWRGREARRVHQ